MVSAKKQNGKVWIALEVLCLALIFYLAFVVYKANYKGVWEFENADILHEYNSAMEVGAGLNPYEKILSGDLLINRKYATLFPLYYYFLFSIIIFSNFVFEAFMANYRTVLFASQILTSLVIYLMFRKKGNKLLGVAAVIFFIFNRWTINTLSDAKQDFLALFLLISPLYFYDTKKKASYLLYGLSLGIKHLGIFIFPYYLLPLLDGKRNIKDMVYNLSLLGFPILVPAIPYLINSYKSFIFSMMFSFTRKPATTSIPFGYDKLLIFYNIGVEKNSVFYYLVPRLPLLIGYTLNLLLLVLRKIPQKSYPFVAMFVFIAFNPVLFDQYITWLTPLLYFSISDIIPIQDKPRK